MKINGTTPPTLLQQVQNSQPARFAKENPAIAAGTVAGATLLAKHAADHSQIAAAVLKKGVVPALGAGAAVLGGTLIHDAAVNSSDSAQTRLLKGAAGAGVVLAGTEVVGRAYQVQALQPLSQGAKFLATHKSTLAGAALTGGALVGAGYALKDMKENGVNLGNAVGLAASTTVAGGLATATAAKVLQPGSKAMGLVANSSAALVGTGLGVTSFALGKATAGAIQDREAGKAVVLGLGTAGTGLASAHVLGNLSGIPALSNLGGKLIGKNPVLTGAVALTAVGVGAYVLAQQK